MWQFMQIYVQQLRMQMGAPTIESAMHMSLAANYIQEHKKDIDHPSKKVNLLVKTAFPFRQPEFNVAAI